MKFDDTSKTVPEMRRLYPDWSEEKFKDYAVARSGKKPCKSCGGGKGGKVPARARRFQAPRRSCPNCARKHIGQAIVLLDEARNGYPDHIWLAIGHLAEAQAEIDRDQPNTAREIREARKAIEENIDADIDLLSIIRNLTSRL